MVNALCDDFKNMLVFLYRFYGNDEMVDYQTLCRSMILGQVLPCTQVSAPFLAGLEDLPRHEAVADAKKSLAYADKDAALEEGRFLMAAMPFARLVMALGIGHGEKILDVGCGAGYTSVLLHRLSPRVTGLEKSAALIERAKAFDGAHGDGRSPVTFFAQEDPLLGKAEAGPFDVIVVEGALASVPHALVDQLSEGGRLGCFIKGEKGSLSRALVITKTAAGAVQKVLFEGSMSALEFDHKGGEASHAA